MKILGGGRKYLLTNFASPSSSEDEESDYLQDSDEPDDEESDYDDDEPLEERMVVKSENLKDTKGKRKMSEGQRSGRQHDSRK